MTRLLQSLVSAGLTILVIAAGPSAAKMTFTTQEGVMTPSLAPIVENVAPGVVSIMVSSQYSVDDPSFTNPFLGQFYDVFPEGMPFERFWETIGSGVIVDAEEGLILSSAHVLENADTVTVRLADGREFPAEIRGIDPDTDIAALAIEAKDLTALTIGYSHSLRVGDYVLAIGSPFGLESTVTLGIVSALGRSGLGVEGYENFVQIDAAINPGNSGGALTNLRGELIGINTALAGPTGGNVGIGFAIPIDMAMQVVAQLVTEGRVDRGEIGITVQDLTPDLARAFGFQGEGGALIAEVLPRSPAEVAGLAAGDIIFSIDGEGVADSAALRLAAGFKRSGMDITLGFLRNGQAREVRVTLRSSAADASMDNRDVDVHYSASQLAGAMLSAVSNGAGRDGSLGGVLVKALDMASPLSAARLLPGDIITQANGHDVHTPQELDDIARYSTATLVVRAYRMGRAFFAVVGG